MEVGTDMSVSAAMKEALQLRNAGIAGKLQTKVLDKAIDIGVARVSTLLEMLEPGASLDVTA